jgi:glyoxylase-like metal-dependent hydrolase (beta-lactamase superfamily II)
MILNSQGKITDHLHAVGGPELPAYLLLGERPALFDAGMTFMGPTYLRELARLLDDPQRLEYNFLTHSHFDHSGAAPYLKRQIPGLKIGASRQAAETLNRPSAIELIRSLCRDYEEKHFDLTVGEDVSFDAFQVDLLLEDGDEVDLGGGLSFRALATPGHTRDSMSFYIPRFKAIIAGESIGAFDSNFNIHPEFLASYRDYAASLQKMAALDIQMILMCHFFILTGDDARVYMKKTIERTEAFRQRILDCLDHFNGDRAAVVRRIYKEDYEDTGAILQEKRPFLINLEAKVRVVAEGK